MNKSDRSKVSLALFGVGALILLNFYFGYKVGREEISTSTPAYANVSESDLSQFWEVWSLLDEKFVATKDAKAGSSQEKVWGAIKGMVDSYGDPYTEFMTPEENELFESSVEGNFVGIGAEIGKGEDGILTVISPLKNSPAEKAGLEPGDKIIQIDDLPTMDMTTQDAVLNIRGKEGTVVKLTVIKKEGTEPLVINITRAVINVSSSDYELRPDGVFVISLYDFSSSIHRDFKIALKEFIRSGSDKMIIDLRGNPGGYLTAAIDIASWFVPRGQVIVSEDFAGKRDSESLKSKGYATIADKVKVAILVDGGSASASEILAGALQEYNLATLVGEKTYGKGSVQELIELDGGSSLKVTIAKWLTPKGKSISGGGLTPDIIVDKPSKEGESLEDAQMNAAVEFLLKK